MRRMLAPNDVLNANHRAFVPLIRAGFAPVHIEQVLTFYDEPHRVYHDRVHLREIFDASLELDLLLTPAQSLALLFHDVIYVPGAARGANEAMSAQLLRVYSGSVEMDMAEAACSIVADTAEHLARSEEAGLVLDLDLMRLAAPAPEFERYSRQVFAEQRPLIAIADERAAWNFFATRRLPFFQRLLERPNIYCTAIGRQRFEDAARDNLRREVQDVKAAGSRGTA
jgi:predicted metal-dependent HD superfamily phosphohydrolase